MVHRVGLAEGQPGIAAVYAGAAGIHQVLHRPGPAGLQQVHKARQVGIHVGVRLVDGITHPRLRRQVQHAGGAHPRKQLGQGRPVGDVQPLKAEIRVRQQARQPRFLQRRVVVGVEVVDADHGVAARQQAGAGVHSDESGSASDKHSVHGEDDGCRDEGVAAAAAAAAAAGAGRQRNW